MFTVIFPILLYGGRNWILIERIKQKDDRDKGFRITKRKTRIKKNEKNKGKRIIEGVK